MNTMESKTVIIVCNCGGNIVPEVEMNKFREKLKLQNADTHELKDLCAIALNEKEVLIDIENRYNNKIIAACYPRAVKLILEQNGIEFSNYQVFNFREESVDSVIGQITSLTKEEQTKGEYKETISKLEVPAWYPVIDKSKCTLCGKCAGFCLFGVYKFNKKELIVSNPLSCKNNCPACGRTCPSKAIIFPKVLEKSFLSGAEYTEMTESKSETENLLATMERRNAKRKSILQADLVEKALKERKIALGELKHDKDA